MNSALDLRVLSECTWDSWLCLVVLKGPKCKQIWKFLNLPGPNFQEKNIF